MTLVQNNERTRHLPGEEGIWLFVIGDMVMFTALFAIFLHYRSSSLGVFTQSHTALNQALGLFNTALMLTSSWCVATAVNTAREAQYAHTRRLLGLAIGCGILFGGVKYFEWSEKIGSGITPASNDFFMFYFVLTGLHMVHVVIGAIILLFLTRIDWRVEHKQKVHLRNLESGASFWHLVDLLWIVLFALLYLAP